MSHSFTCESIILRVYDVGEADRYCILFTRELGRVAARAKAVRRLKSRMGGALLPLSHVRVELKELSSGYILAGAERIQDMSHLSVMPAFGIAEEGMELLGALLQNEEPAQNLFDVSLSFLVACGAPSRSLMLAYTLRVLHILGLLPESSNDVFFHDISDEERSFLRAAAGHTPLHDLSVSPTHRLEHHCRMLLADQLSSPLKAGQVAARMA
ncbi:DNA repair protein RecO [Candidatus Peribacteria bacterium RIFCSPHIGHO2_02_FULL_52_16]|nr:MAG: DNA repair protein RecO [Candidatus Peribacteria bacterium RIFCSPHIGHO2_01_FULL_51_35]OGJ60756.1 MAG: DNA repair protein RecO [Candidatus Peribacteria bacterium RIFCSPHIGHO2_02_FULL_52_16]